MKRVILTPNPYRDKNFNTVREAIAILEQAGVEARACLPFEVDRSFELPKDIHFSRLDRELPKASAVVCFGGDDNLFGFVIASVVVIGKVVVCCTVFGPGETGDGHIHSAGCDSCLACAKVHRHDLQFLAHLCSDVLSQHDVETDEVAFGVHELHGSEVRGDGNHQLAGVIQVQFVFCGGYAAAEAGQHGDDKGDSSESLHRGYLSSKFV